ncbi:MAG: helix-turn-helix domain-containing protein [Succinivibrio sp.]|nr:helix-turn-helix domain-containing protein [Succinivibrio sp.]
MRKNSSELRQQINEYRMEQQVLEGRLENQAKELYELRVKVLDLEFKLRDIERRRISVALDEERRERRLQEEADNRFHFNTRNAGRYGLPADKVIELRKLYEQKLSVREIAEKAGLSRTTVYKYIQNGFNRKKDKDV